MTAVPAYKQRRRMRERAAFIAAVQARTQPQPAAVRGVCAVEFGASAIHPGTVPPERGGEEGCELGGMACSLVANVVPDGAA